MRSIAWKKTEENGVTLATSTVCARQSRENKQWLQLGNVQNWRSRISDDARLPEKKELGFACSLLISPSKAPSTHPSDHHSTLLQAMAGRTVLSTKRARDRRQRASQRASKKTHEATPEREDSSNVSTATKLAIAATAGPVLTKLVDSSSSGEEGTRTASSSDGSDDEEELDGELVIVCRATLPNFCTQFVPATHAADNNALGASSSSSLALREFTATIPAFRETCDGFVTYTIALSTCCEPRKHFQVERRFSEFVALAAALRADNNKPALSDACRQSDGETDGEDGQGQEEERRLADNNNDNDRNSSSSSNGGDAFQWELPPKTWFKLTHTPALEERRRQLEQCLETLLAQDNGAMSRRALVRDFLMLDIFGVQVAEEKQQKHCQ